MQNRTRIRRSAITTEIQKRLKTRRILLKQTHRSRAFSVIGHKYSSLINKTAKTDNGRILYWISDLLELHFGVVHRARKLQLDADAVSKLLNYNDMAGDFAATDRHKIPKIESCAPATASYQRDMQQN